MRSNEHAIQRLASDIVRAILEQERVQPAATEAKIRERVALILTESFKEEEAIEKEAEELAQRHARAMAGMDQRRIVQGIKERLARERGFPL